MSTVDMIPVVILSVVFGYSLCYFLYHSMTCKHCGKEMKQ